ncbi:MAG: type III pantothenate kinase [Clostridia bacterium]|nr:type III pantothenate kinase [Clostridia bacterium]
MLLAINVGNNDITAGVFDGEAPVCSFCIGAAYGKSADEYAVLLRDMLEFKGCCYKEITESVIGSVVPTLTDTVRSAVTLLCSVYPLVVGPGVKTGFRIMLNDPVELGADLAANAVGAISEFGAPVIVCDIGTVTSVNAVDGDKAFRGGAIFPGVGLSLDALGEAELLPAVCAEKPTSPLGKNTVECMNAGVIYGQAAALSFFISAYEKELGLSTDTPVVVTGKYADKMSEYLDARVEYRPLLTLRGLCAIARINGKKQRCCR